MKNTHWMVRLVQIVAGLFVFFGCLVMLIYSPFYSQLVVKGLNRFVSFEINEVAAQSQKMASLSEDDTLEPGSDQWIARQAYFRVMEQDIQKNHSANLMLIQARYKILQQMIEEHQREQQEEKAEQNQPAQVPLLSQQEPVEAVDPTQKVRELLEWDSNENKERVEQYIEFLTTHPLEDEEASAVQVTAKEEIKEDLALLQEQQQQNRSINLSLMPLWS